jgi:putative flippase GtrA
LRDEFLRLSRFAIAGVLGFLVDVGVLALTIAMLGPYWGRVVSFLAAVAATWIINRRYAFADRASGRQPGIEFVGYLGVMLAGGAVNYAVYGAVVGYFGSSGVLPYIGVALGSLAGMLVNLLLARQLVFRHKRQ